MTKLRLKEGRKGSTTGDRGSTPKLSPAEQRRRFIEAARELGTDNGEALDASFGKIVPPKIPRAGEE